MPGIEDVELRQSAIPNAGSGVFAKKDFSPGDIVLLLYRPMIAELEYDRTVDTCAWCCSREATDPRERLSSQQMNLPAGFTTVKACTGCKRANYCSKSCQTKAWKIEHKYECKILADPARPPLPHGVRATIKLLKRYEAGDKAVQEILRFRQKFEDVQKTDPEKFEEFSALSYGAWKYAGEPATLDIARSLFFNVMCNTLTLSTPLDDTHLGVGFDPLVCSINHSCEPNASVRFNCPQFILRARTAIKKGDEITIKYREGSNPYLVRLGELRDNYYFTCTCSKCKKGDTLAEDHFARPIEALGPDWCAKADRFVQQHEAKKLDVSLYKVGRNLTLAERRMTALQAEAFQVWDVSHKTSNKHLGTRPGTTMTDLRRSLELCVESGMWSLTRQPVPYILRAMWADYVATADMDRSLNLGLKRYFFVDPVLEPQPFERIVDTFALAQVTTTYSNPRNKAAAQALANKGCDTRMLFIGLLAEVWENLPKSYGRDSQMGRVVAHIWRTCVGDYDTVPGEVKEAVAKAWPALRQYAEKVDVLKL